MPNPKVGTDPLPEIPFEEIDRIVTGRWMRRGSCTGSMLDMTDLSEGVAEKKGICAPCPVKQDCLRYAILTSDDSSVMGGLRPKERRMFDNGQRWGTCESCGAGYAWVKHHPSHNKHFCRACSHHTATRHGDGHRQHFNVTRSAKAIT